VLAGRLCSTIHLAPEGPFVFLNMFDIQKSKLEELSERVEQLRRFL